MATDAEYLKALADELMCPCMEADLDKEDGRRLYRIVDAHDKLLAERDRLKAALKGLLDNYRHNHGKGLGLGPVQQAKAALAEEEGD